jgi:hypothetical protein
MGICLWCFSVQGPQLACRVQQQVLQAAKHGAGPTRVPVSDPDSLYAKVKNAGVQHYYTACVTAGSSRQALLQ